MTTITFNPENWIDNEATAEVNGKVLRLANGEEICLEVHPVIFNQHADGSISSDPEYDVHCAYVWHRGNKLAAISRFGNDAEWEAMDCGLSRSDVNPFALAGKLAYNLL